MCDACDGCCCWWVQALLINIAVGRLDCQHSCACISGSNFPGGAVVVAACGASAWLVQTPTLGLTTPESACESFVRGEFDGQVIQSQYYAPTTVETNTHSLVSNTTTRK